MEGIIEVTNTEERKIDLIERIQAVLERGMIAGKAATSLRSRLNFADSQIYGRTSAMMLKHLSHHEMRGKEMKLSQSCDKMLRFYKDLLVTGLPRSVSVNTNSVIHMFLDGAIEESEGSYFAGAGGVLTFVTVKFLRPSVSLFPSRGLRRLGERFIRLSYFPLSWYVLHSEKTLEAEQ